jgi:serine/threonine protein phosphatase PrpC
LVKLIKKMADAARDNQELRDMGTTMTAVFEIGRRAFLVHVGDSRGYHFNSEQARQITKDHTVISTFLKMAARHTEDPLERLKIALKDMRSMLRIPDSEPDGHLLNVISKSLTTSGTNVGHFSIDVIQLSENDRFALVSDGLTKALAKMLAEKKKANQKGPQPADPAAKRAEEALAIELAMIGGMEADIFDLFRGPFIGDPAEEVIDRVLRELPSLDGLDNIAVGYRRPI